MGFLAACWGLITELLRLQLAAAHAACTIVASAAGAAVGLSVGCFQAAPALLAFVLPWRAGISGLLFGQSTVAWPAKLLVTLPLKRPPPTIDTPKTDFLLAAANGPASSSPDTQPQTARAAVRWEMESAADNLPPPVLAAESSSSSTISYILEDQPASPMVGSIAPQPASSINSNNTARFSGAAAPSFSTIAGSSFTSRTDSSVAWAADGVSPKKEKRGMLKKISRSFKKLSPSRRSRTGQDV